MLIPFYLSCLAQAHAKLGHLNDAWRRINEAMTELQTTKESWYEADIHRIAGEVALMSPEADTAKVEPLFKHALAIGRAQQAKSLELRAAMSTAELWRDQGKRRQAHDLLAPVYDWFTEGFDTLDLKRAAQPVVIMMVLMLASGWLGNVQDAYCPRRANQMN